MAGQVIINEFLTFVQNKLDVLDELSITQICASNFSEEEIETAKSILYKSCGDKVRNVTRKGEDKKKRNIKDIIKLLKEVDPDAQPTFVAKDLNRLPPVSFDYVDVTRLLKDMTLMKTEFSEFQTKMKTEFSEFQTKMSAELVELNNSFQAQKIKYIAEPSTPDHPKSLPPVTVPHTNNACPSPSVTTGTVFTPTYRDIVHKSARPRRAKITRVADTPTGDIGMQVQSSLKSNTNSDDDFTLVKNKKRKYKIHSNLRGTLETMGKIRVVEPQCSIYVSRALKSVTVSDIIEHITDRGETCCSVELLQQFKETSFNSFKVTIPASKVDTFLEPNFWPTGLAYRRYRERKHFAVSKQPLNGQS